MNRTVAIAISGLVLAIAVLVGLRAVTDSRDAGDGAILITQAHTQKGEEHVIAEVQALTEDSPPSSSMPTSSQTAAESVRAEETRTLLETVQGLPGTSPDQLKAAFENEPIDAAWATPAESQLRRILERSVDLQVTTIERDVQCRSESCRIRVIYANQPASLGELMKLGSHVTSSVREISQETPLASGAIALHSGGYDGELASSEVFLIRSGFVQVLDFWKHPSNYIPQE